MMRATVERSRIRSRIALCILGLGIAVAAFLPRAIDLGTGFMIDEKLWLERSTHFIDAVADARFGDAFTTGHPGVTTMWIGGIALRTLPRDASLGERYRRARLGLAVADVALLLAIWLLARPLLGEAAAAAGTLLLAFDPFLLAHNRVLHLDGLQALAMTASFVALLRASREDSRRMLLVSGALAGIAVLTKTLSAFLVVPAIVVFARDGRGIRRRLLIWLGVAAGVFVLAWPVMWVRPWKGIALMVTGFARGANNDSDAGGFFLGRHVANPGPLFYPVVLALRSSILTLPAGVAASIWAIRRRRRDSTAAVAGAFLAFGLGFMIMMTLGIKTADRYLLPSLAALDLAVAVALVRSVRGRRALLVPALAAALALHAGPALALHPYELAHYNWAAGGPVGAQHALVIGRGEGLDEAARALDRLPGADGLTVASTRIAQFEEFFRGRTIHIEDSSLDHAGGEHADLVLFYISSIQVGRVPAVWARYRDRRPDYELIINGIPYVRVYRVAG
jgi:hypothetical protein